MKSFFLIVFILTSTLFASVGNITSFKGSVKVERDSKKIVGKLNLPIEKNDIISTRDNSNVILKFNDGTIITIGKNSILNIEEYIYDDNNKKNSQTKFNFLKGSFKSVTGVIGKVNPNKFKLKTKTANIGIRGTVTLGNQEIVAVTVGSVGVTSQNNTTVVNAGEYVTTTMAQVSKSKKLTKQILSMLSSQLGTTMSQSNESASSLGTVSKMLEKSVDTKEGASETEPGSHDSGGSCH